MPLPRGALYISESEFSSTSNPRRANLAPVPSAMARQPRIVVPGCPHHITQRGNNRQDIFVLDADRRFYLATLAERCREEQLGLLGYCLMTNHVHLIGVPERADSLARAVGRTNFRYTLYFNRRHGRSGHLWQNRFDSFAVGRDYVLAALAHVDLNPVRAGIVRSAGDYPYSSAAAHQNGRDPSGLLDMRTFTKLDRGGDWAEQLAAREFDEKSLLAIRESTRSGRPLGDEAFVSEIAKQLGRDLDRKPVGRPREKRATAAGKGGQS